MAKWERISDRGDVQDRRGLGPVAVGGIGVGGLVLLLALNFLSGGDIGDLAGQLEEISTSSQQISDTSEFQGEDEYEVFASTVLGSNNAYWNETLELQNVNYVEPTMVLFRTATKSSCGTATSQVGPHYCPLDSTIYLDETFFEELQNRFGAEGGDVAEAYVIAHEVGHHVQYILGNLDNIRTNEDQVAVELQADCFAGLWAGSIKHTGVLAPGEIEEAMDAASAVGDDRIQESTTGRVNPENWTHGSSEQRVAAFTRGYETESFNQCDLQML